MEPKPIQDIAPPTRMSNPSPQPPSEPEIVGDIPVRAATEQDSTTGGPQPAKDNDDSSFIVPAKPAPAAAGKDNQKPKIKDSKPKPSLAIGLAVLATICLAVGAYLKFLANR